MLRNYIANVQYGEIEGCPIIVPQLAVFGFANLGGKSTYPAIYRLLNPP
jgi:hypothetical protein